MMLSFLHLRCVFIIVIISCYKGHPKAVTKSIDTEHYITSLKRHENVLVNKLKDYTG